MNPPGTTAPEILVGLTGLPVASESASAPATNNENAQSDEDVMLGEFLARPRFIGSFTWANASGYDTVPYSTGILTSLLSDSDVMLKLRGFAAAKFDLNVRIQCAGSPYFTGGLAVGWKPTGGGTSAAPVVTDTPLLHPSQFLQLPAHALLDPSTRDNIELTLPFVHCNGVYDLHTPVAYDVLKFGVLNLLRTTGTEVATMVVTIHAWMTNVTLSAPTYQSERSGAVVRSGRPAAMVMRGFASTFARGAADVALTAMGLGAPALAPITRTVAEDTPLYTSNGARSLVTLSEHAATESPIDGIVGVDETSLGSICRREGWVGRVAWTAGVPANLAAFSVQPPQVAASVTVGTTPTTTAVLYSPVGYASLPFSYWRGTLRYRLEVRCNKFCTGTLRIRYLPRQYTLPGFNIKASDVLSKTLDITTGTELVLDCPYSANRPWLRVSPNTAPDTGGSFSNGYVVIDYIEGLKSNGTPVEINVYVSSPDMEFSGLGGGSNFSSFLYNTSTTPAADPTYQSWSNDQYYDVRDIIKLPRLSWVYQPYLVSPNKYHYRVIADGLWANPLPTAQAFPADWTCYHTPFKHFAGLYLCRTGGLRYTINVVSEGAASYYGEGTSSIHYIASRKPENSTMPINTTASGSAVFTALNAVLRNSGSLAMMTGPRRSITYDVPASGQSNWVPARAVAYHLNAFHTNFAEPITHTLFTAGDDNTYVNQAVMLSGADDAGLSYFLGVPFIVRRIDT